MSDANTPEDFFICPEQTQLPIDAINCAHQRADAILTMLIASLGGDNELGFHPHTISNALWQVQANLEQIHSMVNHALPSIK